jgi:RimJ/RimL family protein N-acetyltransferase/aryl carrier-like protein
MVVLDDAGTETLRERRRQELARLLDRDPAELVDSASIGNDLGLDSLARMTLLAWLSNHGVAVSGTESMPSTVGEGLSLLEKLTIPGVSIRLVDGTDAGSPDPAAGFRHAAADTAPRPSLAPVLRDDDIRLATVEREDIRFLYALATDPETCYRWRYRGNPPPIERFTADLWSKVLVQFVARRGGDGEPVGHVVAYGADLGDGYAYLGAVFRPSYTGTGMAARAVMMFVRYLFQTQPLRKLYLEVPSYNWEQIRSGEGRLFQVEGVLRDHEHYAGRFWDRYLCAIYACSLDELPD